MAEKCILLLLDGLGDRSFPEFDHRTPLQAAHTPTLDTLAKGGVNGLFHASRQGIALPSENAHFAMFGYDPEDFPGRGALEALGAEIPLKPDDVALLAHLVEVREENGCLILQRDLPEIGPPEREELLTAIGHYQTQDISIEFIPTGGLFGILVLRGPVSVHVTDTNHMWEGRPLPEVEAWQECSEPEKAEKTARALKNYLLWAHARLQSHPVNQRRLAQKRDPINFLVTQRAGRLKRVAPLQERYGLRGLSIASGMVYWGLSRFLGLEVRRVEDTQDPGADLAARLALARQALNDFDFIHVHTKAPDQAAHSKSPWRKLEVIEALDRGIAHEIEILLDDPKNLLVVTSDHSTPSGGTLIHSGEPVPVTFIGEGVRRDEVKRFDEVAAAAGALGQVRGKDLIYLILNYLDRAKLTGIMDTPVDQPYWPGNYRPFRLAADGGD